MTVQPCFKSDRTANLAAKMPDKVEALLSAHNAEQEKMSIWPDVTQSPRLIDKPGGVPYQEGDEYIYWPD